MHSPSAQLWASHAAHWPLVPQRLVAHSSPLEHTSPTSFLHTPSDRSDGVKHSALRHSVDFLQGAKLTVRHCPCPSQARSPVHPVTFTPLATSAFAAIPP